MMPGGLLLFTDSKSGENRKKQALLISCGEIYTNILRSYIKILLNQSKRSMKCRDSRSVRVIY